MKSSSGVFESAIELKLSINDEVFDDYSSAYSELQSDVLRESLDLDFSDYSPSMWRLLLSELHVERASAIEIPNGIGGSSSNAEAFANAMVRFRGGCRFENGRPNEGPMHIISSLENEIVYPKKYNLNPEVKTLLKRNVGVCSARLRENTKHLENQSQASLGSLKIGDSLGLTETGGDQSPNVVNNDDTVLNHRVSFEVTAEDFLRCMEKKPGLLSKAGFAPLEKGKSTAKGQGCTPEMKIGHDCFAVESSGESFERASANGEERKQWAHEKAKQAAMKLFNDISELEMLRKERDEKQLLKKGMLAIEDNSMKKLAEMENELRKASGHSSSSEAPNMYRLCVVFLTFCCIGYAMPFILCATICCCLPCIISILGFREDLSQNKGATPESINSLPTYKFKVKKNKSKDSGGLLRSWS
ncbi:PREDICTED: MND1-interacting protein 1-like [Ipomoea nil]|uniref:MND1-interacting protein 1-like n=1 Tax=Ipomoea nil TaxID=35883 RepID=UPI0009018D2A|nr:PREDICTED: MND1-interacting protein 1-like [Ipomoea nil]